MSAYYLSRVIQKGGEDLPGVKLWLVHVHTIFEYSCYDWSRDLQPIRSFHLKGGIPPSPHLGLYQLRVLVCLCECVSM